MRKAELYIGLEDNKGNKYTKEDIIKIASGDLECYTITENTGIYKGKEEKSVVITLISDNPEEVYTLYTLGQVFKTFLNQEQVLYTETKLDKVLTI